MEKGTENFLKKSIRRFDAVTKTFQIFSMCVDPKELAIYGAGYYLFFEWLQHMIILFGILTFFAFCCMHFNTTGSRFKPTEITSILDYTMLGNNGIDLENEVITSTTVVDWKEIWSFSRTRPLTLLCDYIYTVIAFAYIFYYNWKLGKTIAQIKRFTVDVSTYALQVQNLPSDANKEELSQVLNTFGPLAEVTISRDFLGYYGKFKDVSRLETQIRYYFALRQLDPKSPFGYAKEIEDFRDQIVKQKREVYLELLNKKFSVTKYSDLPAERAFIIFEKPEHKSQLLSLGVRIQRGNKLALLCCCLKKKTFIEYHNKKLTFEQCEEPNNIRYENLTQPLLKKFFTRMLIGFVILFTICANFLMIYGISRVSFLPRNSVCIFTPTKADIDRDPNNKNNYDYLYCYCRTLSLDRLVSAENSPYCSEYYKAYSINIGLSLASSMAILLCNTILRAAINKFGSKMMFNTVTQELATVTYLTSLSEFLNYFAITILLRGSFLGFQPSEYISSFLKNIHSGFKDDQPVYSDYNSSWYLDIGVKLKDSFLIEILFPHVIMLFRLPIVKSLRYTRALLARIQFDVSKHYRPSRYDIAPVTAHVISQMFVGLALSSGLPILIPSIFCFLLVYYWIQKRSFLLYSEIPKQIDQNFAVLTGKLMYIAVALHCYFGYSLYEAQGIYSLPTNLNPLRLEWLPNDKVTVPVFGEKALGHHVFLVVGILSATLFVFNMIVWPIFESTGILELCSTHPEEDLMLERAKQKEKELKIRKKGFASVRVGAQLGEEGSIEEETDENHNFSNVKDLIKHSKSTSYEFRAIPEYRELLYGLEMFSKDVAQAPSEPPKPAPTIVKPPITVNLPAGFKKPQPLPISRNNTMVSNRSNQVLPLGMNNQQAYRPPIQNPQSFRPPVMQPPGTGMSQAQRQIPQMNRPVGGQPQYPQTGRPPGGQQQYPQANRPMGSQQQFPQQQGFPTRPQPLMIRNN